MKKILSSIMTLMLVFLVASCGAKTGNRKAQELSGAGATFPLPFYNVVFEQFSESNGDIVAYGGIGSGGGIRNLTDKIVDFAGTDAFLTDTEMSAIEPVIHIPTCMGAVVLAYNLDGVSNLNLSGELIADIFAGDVKMWNDSRLVEMNPGVNLPSAAIIPVFRSDGSGTTFVFTVILQGQSYVGVEIWSRKICKFPCGTSSKVIRV